MQYAIALSAFVAAALAQPHHGNHHQKHHQKRDVVLETDMQYVYKTVMVTDIVNGPSPTAAAPKPSSTTVQIFGQEFGQDSDASSSASAAPSVVTVAPSSAPASSSGSGVPAMPVADGDSSSYQGIVLMHHNVHRANHSALPLTWSDDLASTAQQIASTCDYAHSRAAGNGDYGQNIAAGVPASNISAVITDLFYNGEVGAFGDQYGNPNPTGFEDWGHFSQVVWSTTTQVGCYTCDCSAQGLQNAPGSEPYFTVCNYGPPGNVEGAWGQDILPSLGEATVQWNFGL